MPARRFRITGTVQGVFFRAETQKKAQELHIKGWVRNCEDGSVEAHAEGNDDALMALEEWLWEGSSKASVTNVDETEATEEGHTMFTVLD